MGWGGRRSGSASAGLESTRTARLRLNQPFRRPRAALARQGGRNRVGPRARLLEDDALHGEEGLLLLLRVLLARGEWGLRAASVPALDSSPATRRVTARFGVSRRMVWFRMGEGLTLMVLTSCALIESMSWTSRSCFDAKTDGDPSQIKEDKCEQGRATASSSTLSVFCFSF